MALKDFGSNKVLIDTPIQGIIRNIIYVIWRKFGAGKFTLIALRAKIINGVKDFTSSRRLTLELPRFRLKIFRLIEKSANEFVVFSNGQAKISSFSKQRYIAPI